MSMEEIRKIFTEMCASIVELGIRNGYFKRERELYLLRKISEILDAQIIPIDDSMGLAFFDPNLNRFGFNLSMITTKEEAVILIFHELKHYLDTYHVSGIITKESEKSRVGFHCLYDDVGRGLNESTTERFAVNMTEAFLAVKIPNTQFKFFELDFPSNMERYQIIDRLIHLFCIATGINMNEFISMQNDENIERINAVAKKFNMYGNYDWFVAAIDIIYNIRYGPEAPDDYSLSDEDIRRLHECIQIAQDEILKYAIFAHPEVTDELKEKIIKTGDAYRIDEAKKASIINQLFAREKSSMPSNLDCVISQLRTNLEDENDKATVY